jgi:hypothetical protein
LFGVLPKLSVEVRIVVCVHAALESLRIGRSIEKPRSDAQRANPVAGCPYNPDLINLAIRSTTQLVQLCSNEMRREAREAVVTASRSDKTKMVPLPPARFGIQIEPWFVGVVVPDVRFPMPAYGRYRRVNETHQQPRQGATASDAA